MQPYAVVRERLDRSQTVVLDGGIGAELVRRGVRWRGHGLQTDAAAVGALHDEYVAAGAHILRTNTFQLNRRIYRNVFRDEAHMRHIGAPDLERRVPELVTRAVALASAARQSADQSSVAVAGVISPLEHCFRPDLAPPANSDAARAEHAEIAQLLAHAGVDLLLLESMNTIREARLAHEAARETALPVWVSFVVGADGNLLSGESVAAACQQAHALGAQAVLVNCAPPEDIDRALDLLAGVTPLPLGACAHIGRFDPPSWKFEFFPQFVDTDSWPPERYAVTAARWQARGARILGGCCGVGPQHVRALAAEVAQAVP